MTGARESDGVLQRGSAVAVGGRGALILGASGSGKSGLVLRMMALGARLVADDQVRLSVRGGALVATPPARIAGLVEARGVGLIRVEPVSGVPLALAADLDRSPAARLPHWDKFTCAEVQIPLISACGVPNLDAILMVLLQNGFETV
jgi:HPr kinase/phosphorylase